MKKNLTVHETFLLALKNHQIKNFKTAENLFKNVLKKNPNHFEAIFFLGTLSAQLGKLNIAVKLLNQAIEIQPNYVHAYINLGNTFRNLGQNEKAIEYYNKAIKIKPNLLPAHDNLGIVFKELGDYQKAINCYEKAVQIKPDHLNGYNNLGILHGKLKQFEKAKSYCDTAFKIDPGYAAPYYNLGLILQESGNYDQAKSYYEKTIKIKSDYADAHNNLGILLQEQGKFKEAIGCYEKALKCEPENLTYLYQLSDLKKEILDSKLKNKINKIIKKEHCTKQNLVYGNFLISKYEESQKNYKKAFDHLLKGHQFYFEIKRKKFIKEIEYCFNELPKLKELSNFAQVKKMPNEIKPIFIVGVPRSGSTLIEKVIASGTNNIPIGEETEVFTSIIKEQSFKNYIKPETNLNLDYLKERVIEQYEKKKLIKKENKYIFTDKTLANFFYIHIIREIFPNAKIINCKRNPLSSIMSIIKNNLIEISWAHNLEHIFKYFDIYYKTIEIYKKKFPNFIYELEYEKFVINSEKESKKLMNFCNLTWSKKCLEFYKRKDFVIKTTSNIQVRKAIYKDSTVRYLPYKKFLNKYKEKYSWFN